MQAYIMLVMASAVLRFAVLSMCMQPCIRAIGFEELLGKRCRVSNHAGRQEQQQQQQPLLTGLSGLGRLHLQAHCRLWCRSGCQLLHRMPLRPLQKCCAVLLLAFCCCEQSAQYFVCQPGCYALLL